MSDFEHDGIRIHYEDTGEAGTPAVLFLHGAGGNHLSWWQQVPAFQEEYRCITVDQRGFGASADRPGGPGATALATDALALLDHLGIGRCAVVTQSMGGWAAVGAAVLQPARFWAIVMSNTVGNLVDDELVALRRELTATRPPRAGTVEGGALGPSFRARDPARTYLYAAVAGLNPTRATDFAETLFRVATPIEAFAATGVPTFFTTSDEDGLIYPELVEAVHNRLPGSRLLRVPAAGHSVYWEQPDLYNREVAAFLAAYRP